MNSPIPIWVILLSIVLVLLGGSIYLGAAVINRLKERYKDLSRRILVINQDVAVIRESVAQIQQVTDQLERQIVLEQLADLVRISAEEGVVDHKISSKMLEHIWQLKEDALVTERSSY